MTLEQILGIGSAVGGGLLTKEAYDRLSTIGEESVLGTTVRGQRIPGATQLAAESLGLSQFRPFTVTAATGGQFGVAPEIDPASGVVTGIGTQMQLSPQEQAIQQSLLGQAQAGLTGGVVGAPAAESAGLALMGRGREQLQQDPFGILNQQLLAQRAANLGGMFMGQVEAPLAGRETDIYNRIRATQMPEEERQRLALEERLASQGRLGVQTAMYGGTPEQLVLSQAQEEAQNMASLAAIQQAQAEQLQQGQLGAQFAGLGSDLAAQEAALRDVQQQRAIQSLTSGQGMLAGGLVLQQAQQQLGMDALSGAYLPQAQLLNVQQAAQLYPQLQQQAQLFGTGQYGETMMSGLEARLIAEQARANLLGGIGTGLLSGLTQPVQQQGGGVTTLLGTLFSDVSLKSNIEKLSTVNGINLYTWDWNEEGQQIAGDQQTFGVLAQEIAEFRPSAVIRDDKGYLKVDYSKLPEVASLVFLGVN
jgi:hypothetical protein